MRKILKIAGFILLGLLVIVFIMLAIYYPAMKKLYFGTEVIKHDSSLTIYLGGGGNSVVFNSDSAILVVDTKSGKTAESLHRDVEAMRQGKPVIIVNTHSDFDHTGGNPMYPKASIITGRVDESYWIEGNGAINMPTKWLTDTMNIQLGEETVTIIPMGQAHTWFDVVVFFRQRKILVTGDLVFSGLNTFFSAKKGSNGNKSIEALKHLNELAPIDLVIPGHGKPGGRELITGMLEYLTDMSLAAQKPELEKDIRKKYKGLVAMPGISSPAIVIDYFRKYP